MTQEMKLLEALIDALGFDIEKTKDYQDRKTHKPEEFGSSRQCEHHHGKYIIDENGMYNSRLVQPIVDYKLIKRGR